MNLKKWNNSKDRPKARWETPWRNGNGGAFIDALQKAVLGSVYDGNERKGQPVSDGERKRLFEHIDVSVTGFLLAPIIQSEERQEAIAAYSVKGDFPRVLESFDLLQGEENYDRRWMDSFKEGVKDPGNDYFVISTVRRKVDGETPAGLYLKKMAEGEPVRVGRISGESEQVSIARRSLALGWTVDMIKYRKLAQMADIAMTMRDAFYEGEADEYYTLLTAAADASDFAVGGTNPITRDATATERSEQDARTIDAACGALNTRLYGQPGYGTSTNRSFLLYFPEAQRGRVIEALRVRTQAFNESTPVLSYPITPIPTQSGFPTNAVWRLVVPGRKNQRVQEPEIEEFTDYDKYAQVWVRGAHWRYGAGCGNVDQFADVPTA